MAKFVFRMQQMLNVKKQLENSVKNELANAIRDVEEAKELLASLQSQKEEYLNDIRGAMQSGISVQKMREFNSFIGAFENKINNQKKVLNEAEVVADNVREKLVQVVKERKMLEILREKKYQEYKIEEQKKEELAISEVANYRYIEQKKLDN